MFTYSVFGGGGTRPNNPPEIPASIPYSHDALFDNGAQVGPLAWALLAMFYAGQDRLNKAERAPYRRFCHWVATPAVPPGDTLLA
jgi:hypothetical protein